MRYDEVPQLDAMRPVETEGVELSRCTFATACIDA